MQANSSTHLGISKFTAGTDVQALVRPLKAAFLVDLMLSRSRVELLSLDVTIVGHLRLYFRNFLL